MAGVKKVNKPGCVFNLERFDVIICSSQKDRIESSCINPACCLLIFFQVTSVERLWESAMTLCAIMGLVVRSLGLPSFANV